MISEDGEHGDQESWTNPSLMGIWRGSVWVDYTKLCEYGQNPPYFTS